MDNYDSRLSFGRNLSPQLDTDDRVNEDFLPFENYSLHGRHAREPRQCDELNLLQSPRPTSARLASYLETPPIHELPAEVPPGNGSTYLHVHERSSGRRPSPQITEPRLSYGMEGSTADEDKGVAPMELINMERSNYDVDAILAYEQLSTELQAAEDAAAAEQASAGAIIADVAIDNDASMTDAGYESDAPTATSTSVTPSIWDHAFENGRRYHKFREGAYHFPNDDVEQEREDMKHSMVKMLCNYKLHFAPIGPNPHEILDIGTGTGSWAIESEWDLGIFFCPKGGGRLRIRFLLLELINHLTCVVGESYPSASVLGVDLSPIQPDWVPPNVRFMVDDIESPWLHPRNHFDYIHSRHTVMAIKDWDILLRRCYE